MYNSGKTTNGRSLRYLWLGRSPGQTACVVIFAPHQMAWSVPSLHRSCSHVGHEAGTDKEGSSATKRRRRARWLPCGPRSASVGLPDSSPDGSGLYPRVPACEGGPAACSGPGAEPMNCDSQRWQGFERVGRAGPHSPFLETGHRGLLIHPVPWPPALLLTESSLQPLNSVCSLVLLLAGSCALYQHYLILADPSQWNGSCWGH